MSDDSDKHRLLVQFELWHAANPKVYELFKEFTFRAIKRGFHNLSARMVFHRIRWETSVETVDPAFYNGEFKINDHYSPFYARMFMRDHPAYNGFFRTRIAIADNGKLPE